MNEKTVSDFEECYSPLDDEELVVMSARRNTLTDDAVIALDRVIAARNINIAATERRIAEEQAAQKPSSEPKRNEILLYSLAIWLFFPSGYAFLQEGVPQAVLAGALLW